MKTITYLINLDGSHDRLASATAQLQAANWPFERYSAYDGRGKALSEFEHYDDAQARRILGRSLLNSELGCYLSHHGCAEKFLQTDADYLLVLEDDMKISADFKNMLENVLHYLHANPRLDWYQINIAAKRKKVAVDIARIDGHTLWHACYFPIRSLGVIWSRKGAEEFVRLGKTMTMPVDIFIQRWLSENGKGLGVWPPLVRSSGMDSEILGAVAGQPIERKDRENRNLFFTWKKQKRMLRNYAYAMKNFILAERNPPARL